MIGTYILAVAVVLAMLTGWVLVQHLARMMAARHPEFGPAREEGGGCGISCGCSLADRCRHEPDPTTSDDQRD